MKKFLVSSIMFLVFAIGLPLSVEAHNSCPRHRRAKKSYASRNYRTNRARSYNASRNYYANRGYVAERRPSFYRRHRNLINIGIGTGAGALIGGLLGGRRGVAYGLLGGAGAGALYTYKLNPKKRRYYRQY
ncbi:MAG: hypothetical protein ACR2M8_01320 [Pyrinomonadaceae bacterium]|nr:hypothetical protein [Acidobacteriota bacterium]